MSQERRGLTRFLLIGRRHWAAIAAVAVLGLLAGAGHAALTPPVLASSALVALPAASRDTATQTIIARSNPVLTDALRIADPGESPQMLRAAVQVKSLTPNILSISAQGKPAAQAERTADAVDRWGTYPDWIGAVGTFGAFWFAAISYAFDLRSKRRDRRSEQARKVDGWTTNIMREWLNGGQVKLQIGIELVNDNLTSMRDVEIILTVFGRQGEFAPREFSIVRPTLRDHPEVKNLTYLSAKPGDFPRDVPPGFELVGRLEMQIQFTDSTGNRWRQSGGRLEYLGNKPDPNRIWKVLKSQLGNSRITVKPGPPAPRMTI
jgi:hypothetical protein